MTRLIFGMMQSLDGYIDGHSGNLHFPPPGPILHRHFNDHVRGLENMRLVVSHRNHYWVRIQLQPAADGDIKLIWKVAVAPGSTSSDPEIDSEFVPESVSTPDPLFVI